MTDLRVFVYFVVASVVFFLSTSTVYSQPVKICPEDGQEGDNFGVYTAISGDYALIGASAAIIDDKISGAAYIFQKQADTWVQQAKFEPDSPEDDDLFGKILSLDGNYALVTAYNDDDMAVNAGAAYIYHQQDGTWNFHSKIYAGDAAAYDAFGVAADLHNDRAIIGAFSDDDNGFFSGSAYIFRREGNQWLQESKLLASDGAAFDKFGRSVAISEDYAVVCGVLDDDNGEESGSVYIFKRTGTTWEEEIKITPEDGNTGDRFGRSVSIAGDYITISAALKDEQGTDSGAAYVFKRTDGQWVQQAKLIPDDLGAGDIMGYCTNSSENLIAISAHLHDTQGADAGAFYLFKRIDNSWSQEAKFMADTPHPLDHFGICVDLSGDKLICGAPQDQSDIGLECGAAYIYDIQQYVSTTDLTSNTISVFPNPAQNRITINIDENLAEKVISIFNTSGQQVLQQTLKQNSLGLPELIPGSYFFEIELKNGTGTGEFIIQ